MVHGEATRQICWNISHAWLMYVLLIPTLALFLFGIYRHVRLWLKGAPLDRFNAPYKRLKFLLHQVALQNRIARDAFVGIFHRAFFWAFVILLTATVVVMIDYDFHLPVMKGYFYLIFQSLLVDIAGAAAMIGLLMAAFRRWVSRPDRLTYSGEASFILVLLFSIMLTGFLLEGLRICATHDPSSAWSPIGRIVASLFDSSPDSDGLRSAHGYLWWTHLLLVYSLIALTPYSKMFHVVTASLNTLTANLEPIGANLKPVDVENSDNLGVNEIFQFTWKDLLDLDACTECGRCTASCPAHISGKSLSPRGLILDLRQLMHEQMRWNGHRRGDDTKGARAVFDRIDTGALWECTTCAACVEACPVYIEQMPKIIDLRRHLVMEKSEFPETMQEALMSLEDRGHPFRGARATRMDWTKGLHAPLIPETPDFDILLWVGSAGALLDRGQQVIRSLASILNRAGVKFAILGREEKSTGDLARRIGNEYLFESIARENIEVLNRYNVTTILTACPHGYNSLKNEYPRLGGHYKVHHHSEYLWNLVRENRLPMTASLPFKVTYHDSCYLGRHNGIIDAPRRLIESACKAPLLEMVSTGRESMCCGGGGGLSFTEEPVEKRVSRIRARQALDTGAEVIAVACPYCMTMLEDAVKAEKGDRQVRVMDIAEVILEAIEEVNP
jgi:Fe-S oxidoreductase/nitrate reductase gamma subunit